MIINKTKITKETFWVNCPKCNKKVSGVSEKQVEHNFKIHKIFCKGKK